MLGGAGVRCGREETFFKGLVIAMLKWPVLDDELVEVLVREVHVVVAGGAVAVPAERRRPRSPLLLRQSPMEPAPLSCHVIIPRHVQLQLQLQQRLHPTKRRQVCAAYVGRWFVCVVDIIVVANLVVGFLWRQLCSGRGRGGGKRGAGARVCDLTLTRKS